MFYKKKAAQKPLGQPRSDYRTYCQMPFSTALTEPLSAISFAK